MEKRTFIVEEEHIALQQTYIFNGMWDIVRREQLRDGRWMIDCVRRKDW